MRKKKKMSCAISANLALLLLVLIAKGSFGITSAESDDSESRREARKREKIWDTGSRISPFSGRSQPAPPSPKRAKSLFPTRAGGTPPPQTDRKRVDSSPQLPAMFVFGDSLVDNGNNNNLSSLAKANYYPYGIDFSQGITGRFTNGKTTVDALCDLLGIPYLPPYNTPGLNGTRLLGGVNYASAAAGILDESGKYLGERFPLSQQVINFENNLYELRDVVGEKISDYLAKSIVVMVFGSNDYINNYLLPSLYTSRYKYTPEQFANLIMNTYTRQILALHSLGLRKFLLAAVGPIGCTPNQRSLGRGRPDRCVDQVNEIVGFFNRALRSEVEQLNNDHPGAIFVYGNTYGAIGDVLNNPANYGFEIVERGCCGIDLGRGAQITCLPFVTPCGDRDKYVFWDAYHPTTAVNLILAQRAYAGSPTDCYPINVQQMVQI